MFEVVGWPIVFDFGQSRARWKRGAGYLVIPPEAGRKMHSRAITCFAVSRSGF